VDDPGPRPDAETIAQLDPRVFDQLYELVSFGNPPEGRREQKWQKAQDEKSDEPREGGDGRPFAERRSEQEPPRRTSEAGANGRRRPRSRDAAGRRPGVPRPAELRRAAASGGSFDQPA
jgi:hypothetical protein